MNPWSYVLVFEFAVAFIAGNILKRIVEAVIADIEKRYRAVVVITAVYFAYLLYYLWQSPHDLHDIRVMNCAIGFWIGYWISYARAPR